MSQFVHIVYIHPLENGLPNLHKITHEREFQTKDMAMEYILNFNNSFARLEAVYYGCVNDETGELV